MLLLLEWARVGGGWIGQEEDEVVVLVVDGMLNLFVLVAEWMRSRRRRRMLGVLVAGVRAVEAGGARRRRHPGPMLEVVAALVLEKEVVGSIWDMEAQTFARLPIACGGRLVRLLPKDLPRQVVWCSPEQSVSGSCFVTGLLENLNQQVSSGCVHALPVLRFSRSVRADTALHELWLLPAAVRVP